MKIGVFHKGWLLHETDNETKAWLKAREFQKWFSQVGVRKIEQVQSEEGQRR